MADEVVNLRETLLELIEHHKLSTHARLPTERELAETLGVSRWSVRKALATLEAEGRLWRHVGRGTFVGPRPAFRDQHLELLCEHGSPTELIDARMLLEPRMAALATVRATRAEIERMSEACHKCRTARDIETYEVWDEAFHRAVATAAHNDLLMSVFNGLNAVRKATVWGHLRRSALRPERRRLYARQHEAIVVAINNRSPQVAERAMWEHLKALENTYRRVEQAGDDMQVSL